MALITKPDFTYVWASGGAVVAPNDSKKQLGWVAEAPPFQYDNWLQNRQDQMLAHINQRGIPAWDALTNYEAGGLSYVQGSDGKIYKSVAASGPSATVQNPTTDVGDTYWTEAFASIGAFLTQTAADALYAQRSNNLSDLTNASTARANLGLSNTVTSGISGSFSKLKVSTTGQSAVVTVTANSVCLKDSSNAQIVLNNISVTPSVSALGANGLDTGTSAINTWYYVWVIWNGTTTAGLISLSETSPTMPSGYTYKALVSVLRTDGTGNKYPLSFQQADKSWWYKTAAGTNVLLPPIMSSGVQGATNTTLVAIAVGAFVSPIASQIMIGMYNGTGSVQAYSNNTSPLFDGGVGAYTSASSNAITTQVRIPLESGNIYYAASTAGCTLRCQGQELSL